MTEEQVIELILGVAGVILQLVYKFVPAVKNWLDNFEYKGLVILGLDVAVGGILFALACSPYAADLGIGLACETATVFLLLRALVSIAIAQQFTFLVLRNSAKG